MQTPEQNKWEGEHQAGNPTALQVVQAGPTYWPSRTFLRPYH